MCARGATTRSAYPRSHTAPDVIALAMRVALIFEEMRPRDHRVVTAAEGVRDVAHAGALHANAARPRILLYRDFRSVVDARLALLVAGVPKGTFNRVAFTQAALLHGGSLGTSGEVPAWQGPVPRFWQPRRHVRGGFSATKLAACGPARCNLAACYPMLPAAQRPVPTLRTPPYGIRRWRLADFWAIAG